MLGLADELPIEPTWQPMRDMLLPKLVTGQIDVSDLDFDARRREGGRLMPNPFNESAVVEQPALELLAELGWTVVNASEETFGSAGTLGRDSTADVVLVHRLRDAIRNLNPAVPDLIREEALAEFVEGSVDDGSGAGQPGGSRPAS